MYIREDKFCVCEADIFFMSQNCTEFLAAEKSQTLEPLAFDE
jgi:hypothetical protein